MEYKKGSLVSYKKNKVHTIALVDSIKDNLLVCKTSFTSIDGGKTYKPTQLYNAKYKGEDYLTVEQITPEDFNFIIDTSLIAREQLKNVT